MVAYTYQMPSGIAGNNNRPDAGTVEQGLFDSSYLPASFGIPLKKVSGKVRPLASGDVASAIVGFLVRPFPTSGNGTDGLGVATPNASLPADVMKRGYISVKVNGSTAPADGGLAYVRVANGTTNQPIGGIEAALDASIAGVAGSNTGTGTISAVSAGANAIAGVYKAICRIVGTNACTWNLYDPNGKLIDQKQIVASGGTAVFANDQINATITDGATDFVVGDSFNITVTQNTVVVPNATFTGSVDSYGFSEIRYNI